MTRPMRENDDEHRCTATDEEHFCAVHLALADAGVGGGCEGTYKALLRLAKMLQHIHGYAKWECPDDDAIMVDTLAKSLALQAQLEAMEREQQ